MVEFDAIPQSKQVTKDAKVVKRTKRNIIDVKNIEPTDKGTYTWSYKNDENENMGLTEGSVVSGRKWQYGLTKYAAVVQVGISFRCICTFSFLSDRVSRILKVVDDNWENF